MDSEKTLLRLLTEITAMWAVWLAVIYADWALVAQPLTEAHRTVLAPLCMAAGCYLANILAEFLGNKFESEA